MEHEPPSARPDPASSFAIILRGLGHGHSISFHHAQSLSSAASTSYECRGRRIRFDSNARLLLYEREGLNREDDRRVNEPRARAHHAVQPLLGRRPHALALQVRWEPVLCEAPGSQSRSPNLAKRAKRLQRRIAQSKLTRDPAAPSGEQDRDQPEWNGHHDQQGTQADPCSTKPENRQCEYRGELHRRPASS